MISKFIFEDNKDAVLPKLFCCSYPDTSHICYTSGAQRIVNTVKRCLSSSDGEVVVFVDCVPDNKNTILTYSALKAVSVTNNFRCVALPIVCAEYYYLMSLPPWLLRKETHMEVISCMGKQWYRDEKLLKNHNPRSYCNFEKYCKLLCEVAPVKCAKLERDGATKIQKHPYTHINCPCTSPLRECHPISLLAKSRSFLRQYPCIPFGSLHAETALTISDLWELHRKLVAEFNDWSDEFCRKDPANALGYRHIDVIK